LRWLTKKYKVTNAATLNDYRRQTASFFDDLIGAGLTTVNPFKTTKRLPEGSSTKTWFRIDVQSKLQDLIEHRDYQLWLSCMVQFYCFVRPGEELQSLRIEDIMDPDSCDRKFKIECTHAKSGVYRYVPIPEMLWKMLQPYINGYPSHYFLFGKGRTPSAMKIGKNTLYERHKYYMQYLELPEGYSHYSWKNTGAVMMYKNGVKMKYISLLMGHYDFSVTDRYFRSLGIDDVMDEVKINYPTIGQKPIKPPAGQ
jgi:integrase